ncbi:KipI family sensor histidine kinase inhibitor [Variovorax boronicumulans]|uniref:KipI family sensor histidine kinase inhibitor n=1 Tax=Variovorax boronicumulans TaxID=436515 RepID=A0AAW8CXJ7_9BURK|nr:MULTISPECIES: 5-oxoprolinase subunit PxpB [Variovorax]MDP9892422.1 KipI family sensor histidine kinase inhibitor [Variovorax boronicumulans]MDP9990467.1 KipI family sensor histidine kinase inhibitor [Variovorax boronicumulans]MDQ0001022.1 KipI family sensor histidine kinase inhibitor [Variovorax boronicumulans]MDQ0033725.1 KipI family sensor histidine kinase inhibitor [Variovorax boronicumulans]MDQ0052098.1 KipI family sensor histidine kinase inhibitor [Variovorax boronicumulans]
MSGLPPPRLHLLGDAALLCELPAPATLVQQQRIWALAAEAREWPGVGEVLPGMNNLTLTFDPTAIDLDALTAQVLEAWPKLSAKAVEGRLVEIPVAYGGEHGPDLGDVAAHTGFTPAEVVRRHSAGAYVVYLLGFLPGFAFMGGLAPELATPRRAEPRTAVPARSVGIGGEQTGIYPLVSPGGWQLIGRTSLEMFDPTAESPTLLRPGDRVRFVVESVET